MTTTDVRERLAQPLPYPTPPVIVTPAMREQDDDYRDHLKARVHLDRAAIRDWVAEAREKTFGPLDAWLTRS